MSREFVNFRSTALQQMIAIMTESIHKLSNQSLFF
jgi:hypothetical protein